MTVVKTDNTALTCGFFMISVVGPVGGAQLRAPGGRGCAALLHRDDFVRFPRVVVRRI
ncbi:hypothetical protein ACH4RA_01360 [Streptomyces smyrnaeus]|uniref:hypothetical protein n=1 Tax=Streptomyces TaxID=1883 RepID=UPI0015D47A63|nr:MULTISPECIES: hypothetical protein [unclassified Streptomyces]MBQ0862482.1 hypothetical protein [Streptomyces sp. RK75]MBQ1120745.1 hypothetical protein [Streptomyces sp. B15]